MTLVMVTHEMRFARKVSDRVVFMLQGKVHEMGPPEQLFDSPRTPELQQFLSSLHWGVARRRAHPGRLHAPLAWHNPTSIEGLPVCT